MTSSNLSSRLMLELMVKVDGYGLGLRDVFGGFCFRRMETWVSGEDKNLL